MKGDSSFNIRTLAGYPILSLAGLVFLILIYPSSSHSPNPNKDLFLIIFITICLMGILAAVYPSKCLKFFNIETFKIFKCKGKAYKYRGHHPDCGEFKEHTFNMKDKIFCVGCNGLLVGSLLAIFTCLLYLFYGAGELLFWMGMLMVSASLLQMILLNSVNRWVKFLSNLGLVWGSSLIFVSLLDYGDIFLVTYFLFLVLALIFTRTILSEKNHRLICMKCDL